MVTKPQFFYDLTTKQALGFQYPFYLKKAQQLEPKLHVGDIIEKTNLIVIPDFEETLLLAKESHSKMILKQKDPIMFEKKVNTTPVNYVALNQLYKDYETRFVPQTELSAEQAFWSQNLVNSPKPILSSRPTIVEVPKELPKVRMVNTSLKKLKHHLAGFDVAIKERTTPTTITEGSWGFEHTKACFRDEIIPFVKVLKDLFNTFNQYLVDELSEVHNEQVLSKDIVNIIVNSFVNNASVNVHECEKCLQLETELQTDFIEKEIYDKLFKSFTTLEKHCISLEVDSQLNQEFFQRDNPISNQSAPSFDQLFELNELNAQSQEKDTVIKKLKERIKVLSGKKNKDKIKQELEETETINIELDLKSVEISDLNASLQEKVLVITALKDDLRKLKGKVPVDNDITKHPSDPEMLKIDVEPITPKLLNKQTAHSAYIKHTQEEATELLTNISKTCPSINIADGKLVAVTPKNKNKSIRFTKPITFSGFTITKIDYTSNIVYNKPMLSSTGVKLSTSASGSQPSGNTKKDKIRQTPSSTQKNKVEAHPRKVKSSLKNKDCVVAPKGTANVQHPKLNANSELKCVKCNGCMLSDNHDLCVLDFINNVNARVKSKSRPTGQTFTIVGNVCPLTRITTTTEVPLRKPTALENETPKPIVTLVYSRKPRKSKTNVPVNKSKVVQIVLWYLDSGCSKHMTGDRSQLTNFVNKFLGTFKFGNDHVVKILGYGDYQIRNVTISRVYYVEGLGHNLFFVGQFCDSNLKVAFHQHTCFICNLEGVDLLTGSRGNNMYTLSLGDMMASSPICFLSKASKTKSWLWHRRLSHLNFGAINHLAKHGLVRGLPKLKFEKGHLYSACAMGKSKKKPHKPKSEDTNKKTLSFAHGSLWTNACRKYNGTEFINKNLREYYEKVGISHETSVSRSPQKNGVVERRNYTLIEPARTMLNYAKAPLFLWAEAVAIASPEVIALIAEVVTPEPVVSNGSPSSTTVDQDAPSPSNSQTTPKTQSPILPNDVEEDNHDLDVAHMNNDPFFGIPIPEDKRAIQAK
ncbi:retrovirus-related pol polyprotein from transposon TNT 1-94 [Tanacetum coccineum]